MVAYSFKRQFIEPIQAGTKRQTIRSDRKRHARAGEALQLYFGMRTRQCRKIGDAVCDSIAPVRILVRQAVIYYDCLALRTAVDVDNFARADGFEDWFAMQSFWQINHPDTPVFSGMLIRWRDFVHAGEGEV